MPLLRGRQFDKNTLQVYRQGRIRRDGVERQLAETVDEVLTVRGFDGHGRLRKREDPAAPGDEIRRIPCQLGEGVIGGPDHQRAGEPHAHLIPMQVQVG